jgi:hypothetical protein
VNKRSYEKALGLSFWDRKKLEKELWARAYQGDELSYQILLESLADEAEKEKLEQRRKGGGSEEQNENLQ